VSDDENRSLLDSQGLVSLMYDGANFVELPCEDWLVVFTYLIQSSHDVLAELGGDAPWRDIQKRVTEKRGSSYAGYKNWLNFNTTMHQLLQQHCAGYRKFNGTVLFEKSASGLALAGTYSAKAKRVQVPPENVHPETVSPGEYLTGDVRQVLVNAYERDPSARRECLEAHGTSCIVCQMNFESVYGSIGRGFIHVHHKRPLSSREVYRLNPVGDLVPVCPNCHAMLHTSEPPLDVEELVAIVNATRIKS
jgi:HNH endonuclease